MSKQKTTPDSIEQFKLSLDIFFAPFLDKIQRFNKWVLRVFKKPKKHQHIITENDEDFLRHYNDFMNKNYKVPLAPSVERTKPKMIINLYVNKRFRKTGNNN